MKILHTADWHLGKKLDAFDRMEEQKAVMAEICGIAESEKVDAVLIAGDLFDNFNPSTESQELLYKTLKKLSRNSGVPVVAIAGNHDSANRVEAPDVIAKENAIFFLGYPDSTVSPMSLDSGVKVTQSEAGFVEFSLPSCSTPLRLITTPYANEPRMHKVFHSDDTEQELREMLQIRWAMLSERYCDESGVNILLSHHFFVASGQQCAEETDDSERPILHLGGSQTIGVELVPKSIDYVALGHLHRYQNVNADGQIPVVYSGSPLAYSFSEENQDKFVVILEVNGKTLTHSKIQLKKGKRLIRRRFEDLDSAITWLRDNPDTLVELTLVRDEFLTSSDKQTLNTTHSGIIAIIPEIKRRDEQGKEGWRLDLTQNIESLFKEYYKSREGVEPDDELLAVFREVIAEERGEE